ncbi:hypothetical protein DFH27DRAFT_539552 [Peziza echinospora]|nr:hypothetical protein DFH27DRAFT_539552 [Peziza echinospora]
MLLFIFFCRFYVFFCVFICFRVCLVVVVRRGGGSGSGVWCGVPVWSGVLLRKLGDVFVGRGESEDEGKRFDWR